MAVFSVLLIRSYIRNSIQHHFPPEIGIDIRKAFIGFNCAPPMLRRNIDVLGFLHKGVLGKCYSVCQKMVSFHRDVFGSMRPSEDDKQLYGYILVINNLHALHSRSVFGMVYMYNRLPQDLVDCATASVLQKGLTLTARSKCQSGDLNWMHCFSCGRPQVVVA